MIHILGYGIGLYILKNILTTTEPPAPQGDINTNTNSEPLTKQHGEFVMNDNIVMGRQRINCKEFCKTILNKEEQKSESVFERVMAKRSINKQ